MNGFLNYCTNFLALSCNLHIFSLSFYKRVFPLSTFHTFGFRTFAFCELTFYCQKKINSTFSLALRNAMSDFKKNSTELKSYIQKLENKEKDKRNSRKIWLLGALGLIVLLGGVASYMLSPSLGNSDGEYMEPEDIFVDIPFEEIELIEEYQSLPEEGELEEALPFEGSPDSLEEEVKGNDEGPLELAEVEEAQVEEVKNEEEALRKNRPQETISVSSEANLKSDTQKLVLPPPLPVETENTPTRGLASIPLQEPLEIEEEEPLVKISKGSQSADPTSKEEVKEEASSPKVLKPMVRAQAMPEFPGGKRKLLRYFNRELKYPSSAKDNQVEGSVRVGFIIEPDGSISNPKVIKGLGYGCDEEALRLIKNMPGWSPGMNNGQPVRIFKILSITFTLQ